MGRWVRVCAATEAPAEGGVMEAEVEGVSVCLARWSGELWALDNLCPHRQGPLGQGWMEGPLVVCPWHARSFDVRSGLSEFPGKERVAVFPVKVAGEEVLVEIEMRGTLDGSAAGQS